ncbi:MAG: hypothetical protein KDH96_12620, partial [Candidatus Riesia sp.]|nr:hypothetical protein [Candidatus Riesia sp.]
MAYKAIPIDADIAIMDNNLSELIGTDLLNIAEEITIPPAIMGKTDVVFKTSFIVRLLSDKFLEIITKDPDKATIPKLSVTTLAGSILPINLNAAPIDRTPPAIRVITFTPSIIFSLLSGSLTLSKNPVSLLFFISAILFFMDSV